LKIIQKAIVRLFAMSAVVIAMVSVSHALTYTYATDVRWNKGSNVTLSDSVGSRYNQTSALGAPSLDFLSLGIGGLAVFDFGVDFNSAAIVFETTGGNRATYALERANVYVANSIYDSTFNLLSTVNGLASISTTGFTSVGIIDNRSVSTVLDVAGGPFRYVLIQDISASGSGLDGFDVNAVGVAPVPEPGTMVLLGAGLLGLAIFGKRRMNREA